MFIQLLSALSVCALSMCGVSSDFVRLSTPNFENKRTIQRLDNSSVFDYLNNYSYLFSNYQIYNASTYLASGYTSMNTFYCSVTLVNTRYVDIYFSGGPSLDTFRAINKMIVKESGASPHYTNIQLGYATSQTSGHFVFTYVSIPIYEVATDTYGFDIPEDFGAVGGSMISQYNVYCIRFVYGANYNGLRNYYVYGDLNANTYYERGKDEVLNNYEDYGFTKTSEVDTLINYNKDIAFDNGVNNVLDNLSDYDLYTESEYNTFGYNEYLRGVQVGSTSPYGIDNLFISIADIPFRVLSNFLIIPIFGTTLWTILGSLVTLLLVVYVIKKVV